MCLKPKAERRLRLSGGEERLAQGGISDKCQKSPAWKMYIRRRGKWTMQLCWPALLHALVMPSRALLHVSSVAMVASVQTKLT